MRHFLTILLLVTSTGSVLGDSFYALMKEGVTQYQTGELQQAQETFSSSVTVATNDTEQMTIAQYNLANTEHRLGNFQGATELYGDALNHEDPNFRADAFYNRGLSMFELSKTTEEAEQLDEAIMQVSTAMGMFEQSLELNAEAQDAKTNLELAYLRHEELLAKKKEQEQEEEENKDQDENGDEENKDEDKKNEEKQDEDQKGDENQDENEDPQEDPENSDEEQNQDQEQPNEQDPSEDEQQNADQQGDPDQQDPSQAEQGEAGEEQKMTPEEADMLLDALREKEKADRARFRMRYGSPPNYPVEKPY